MKKYVERFLGKKFSIQRKVIIVYLFFAVLPIILITLLSSIIYYNNIIKGAYGLVEQNAMQHEIVVRERMDSYENVLYELVTNKEYIDLAQKVESGDEKSFLIDGAHMERLLQSSVYTYDAIRSITFLSGNDKFVSYSKWYGSKNENIWADRGRRREVYEQIQGKQRLTFIATVNLNATEAKEDFVILMGFPVKNLRTKEESGVLVVALEDDVLLFDNIQNQKNSNDVSTVVLDEKGRLLAGVQPHYINDKYENYLEKEFGSIKRISENKRKIQDTEWTIVNIIDTEAYRKDIDYFIKIVFGLMGAITCIFFFILFFISKKYIGTIQRIAQNIRDYEGTEKKEADLGVDERDELYAIASQFSNMKNRINSLVDTLKQRNEEVRTATISQKHAEIKALEAQINPHFLFNTLDSINWRAIEHEEEEISNMLGALGSLLRYSVSNIDMEVFLEAEISWLKKYIFLQRDRFHNSFDCSYKITQEAMSFPIYKMLLQPIIENTILHAFEEVKEGGLIEVEAFVDGRGKLEIHVRDNGRGMPQETLTMIRKEIRDNGPLNSRNIGISNVIHRLRIYYQEEAQIMVNSRQDEGTEFILIIPNKREGEIYK